MGEIRALPVQRDLFDIPPDVAYFNVASLGPTLRSALAAGDEALRWRAQPWRVEAADWFESAERRRTLFARLVNADAEGVALIPATSYGMAVAATNLTARPGQRILVLDEEYPSGVYTWRSFADRTGAEILTVRREPGQPWTDAILANLDERVAVVSVPQVHWTDGALVELTPVARRSREVDAAVVVDASQSVGAMPLDVDALRPDFLVAVGYKWQLGQFGMSYLYVAERHREGRPLEQNWILRRGSESFGGLVDYQDEYQPGARRFDVGQRSQLELTPMTVAALEQVLSWGVDDIAATLKQVTAAIEEGARARGLEVPEIRGPHMLGVRVPEPVRDRILQAMVANHVYVGARGQAIRISPHLHTTDEDIARLLAVFDQNL